MSKANSNKKNSKKKQKKLFVRIMAMFLALLMVAGVLYYTIVILASSVRAEDTSKDTKIIDSSELTDLSSVEVAVGLMYGDNITTGFQTYSENGYIVGIEDIYGDRTFDEIWELDEKDISCTSDANLSKNSMTYLIAESRRDAAVGGYHVQIDCDSYSRHEVEYMIDEFEYDMSKLGLEMFPAYIYTGYAIRIGQFTSYSEAEEYVPVIEDIIRGEYISVVSPTDTAVSLIEPNTDVIMFEYDCGGKSELGLKARRDENGNTYIKTPAGNVYDGVFTFSRYDNGEVDGVSLTNVVPLEAYIAGVLPFETSNEWPIETQKAFAITVRSFTLSHMNDNSKHSKYSFDLCNTTDCQVYKGAGRINESVMEAVTDTAGQVLTYDRDIVTAFYSSSVGGVTVSAKDAWGGTKDYPYLQAVETPWEDYMNHYNGFWISEISPKELLQRLNNAGYIELKGEISDIEITELSKDSTYIKQLKVTDIYGTTVYINTSDKVRTSLTPYVKSANFVVGHGSVEYTESTNVEPTLSDEDDSSLIGKDSGYMPFDDYYVERSSGTERKSWDDGFEYVMTSSGSFEYEKLDAFVITSENASAFGDETASNFTFEDDSETDTETEYNTHVTEVVEITGDTVYKIAYAEDKNNFIFVGKGWGHGVGMSQFGAYDLGKLGYSAEEILKKYFINTEIIDYRKTNDYKITNDI